MSNKRRILILADTPTCSTGFATVSKNVLKSLHDTGRYEIDMVGINYDGNYDQEEFKTKYPYIRRMIMAKSPTSPDMFGRELTKMVLCGRNKGLKPPYDVFFTIQDHFILASRSANTGERFSESIKILQQQIAQDKHLIKNNFLWIGYWPVDGKLKPEWVTDCIDHCDYPVAYCDYGAKSILDISEERKEFLSTIRHGTNTKQFYPLPKEERKKFRKEFFGKIIDEDTFLIVNVNRNQPRKDLFRTLLAYKKFREKVPNAYLYMHCKESDVGGNLVDMAKNIGLDPKDWARPNNFDENVGVPVDVLNKIYNCGDAYLTTTLGEGWGLGITEAMATKTPVCAPAITSIPEILGDGERGWLHKAGNDNNLVCYGMNDNDVVRPVSDVDDIVSNLLKVYNDKEDRNKRVEAAYKYASELTWENENKKWVELFDKACEVNDKIRNSELKEIVKQKPNDKCSCGSGKKFKKCCRN